MSGARHVDVLLIEDNPTDVLLTREILGEGPHFQLRHAERLSKGIAMLSDRAFDVILLDLGLPDSQGLDTLLRLRESNAAVPIVVMTGRDDEEVALRAVNLGAQDYLVKSIVDEGALRRSIRYAIERNQTEEALRERAALASMNAEVGVAFTRGGALAETLGACAESLLRGLDATLARVWTLDAAGTTLELASSAGLPTVLGGRFPSVPVGEGAIGRVASERLPFVTNELPTSPALAAAERNAVAGLVACAAFPLLVGDRLVGVVGVASRRRFSPAMVDAAASAANLVAIGIERERSENTLREVNRTLNSLFDAAPAAIMVLDARGSLLRWNATAERMFGWSEAEAIGRRCPEHDHAREEFRSLLASSLVGETLDGVEVQPHHRDGSSVDVALWTAPIRDDAGVVVASLGIFIDIAHRKQLEAQLHQSQKMEAIGLLAGGVAHDFNNLLTIIGGYSELIRRDLPPGSRIADLADEILDASERAASLTRQLLAFSRRQVLAPAVLNLNALVTGVERMLRRLIGEDITLVSTLDPELGAVRTDPGQVEQVLMNFAVNARDAMPHGGRLTVETRNVELDESFTGSIPHLEPGSYVLLGVSDTGVGMDAETMTRAFEPFFTTKGLGRGTGLGLATVYGIVRQSGGHVEVSSERGAGSTFEVYLPRVTAAPPECEVACVETAKPARGHETVLLAEDEAALRALTRRVLEMNGYAVLEAVDGEDGMRVAAEFDGKIHILVTDVVMPRMSGSQLAERLQAIRPEIHVLYLSGYTDDAVVRHGILHAETAFLQKPFTPATLAKKVREVLDYE